MYTEKYGHQQLRKIERNTIRFNGVVSVELDYSGMHPRMLYHLKGIDYVGDPYRLWGDDTTGPLRLLAKQLINSMINAGSDESAVAACNFKMRAKTRTGKDKTGKKYDDARRLYAAYRETKMSFKAIVPLVRDTHKQIAEYFGTDRGIKLMNREAKIALSVMYQMAKKGVPCLSCHDGFRVPITEQDELRRVMHRVYEREIGYAPIVRKSSV
jgi:hypothetical protein